MHPQPTTANGPEPRLGKPAEASTLGDMHLSTHLCLIAVRLSSSPRGLSLASWAPVAIGPSKLNPDYLIETFGTIGLIAIIFAESGLLVGFFLPGDSLLFIAGFLASEGKLELAWILPGCFLAAVIGDQVGYMFGTRVGPRLFDRPDSRLFKQEFIHKTNDYFERNGPRTILIARFVPVVRTFAPILAGVGNMRYRTFFAWNVIGGLAWAVGIILVGYFFGDIIPDKYFEPAILAVVLLSLVPVALEIRKHRRDRSALPPVPPLGAQDIDDAPSEPAGEPR